MKVNNNGNCIKRRVMIVFEKIESYFCLLEICYDYIFRIFASMNMYDYLLSYNIKPSVQRLAIMEYLYTHRTHPSIDEIYAALCKKIPTLSKTTVYNTLKLFVENGAASMLTIDEKNACFDADTSLHAHFLCRDCGKIYDFPAIDLSANIKEIQEQGFVVDDAQIFYKGICADCHSKKAN